MNEHNKADRVLIRAKDVGLVIGILTLAGMLWKVGSKPFQWDQAMADVGTLKNKLDDHEKRLTVIEARFLDNQDNINRQLGAIYRKLEQDSGR